MLQQSTRDYSSLLFPIVNKNFAIDISNFPLRQLQFCIPSFSLTLPFFLVSKGGEKMKSAHSDSSAETVGAAFRADRYLDIVSKLASLYRVTITDYLGMFIRHYYQFPCDAHLCRPIEQTPGYPDRWNSLLACVYRSLSAIIPL